MEHKNPAVVNFSIEPVTDFTALSPIISKARVRIFYTGLNRNLTYISEEFAERLLSTLPYTPVGGLWDDTLEDFSDHGGPGEQNRGKFKAFGVVPQDPNLSWESHLDKDGILRRYACCDVYLWTARYEEARQIPNKAQSMELYLKSVEGSWKRDGAVEYFEFTDAQFFGLTALGEGVEPCFEGAAFYGLQDNADAETFFTELKKYTLSTENQLIGGTEKMDNQNTPTTVEPIAEPVVEPTEEPTVEPVEEPVATPVDEPAEPEVPVDNTVEPTEEPAEPTEEPVEPTEEPTEEPIEEPVEEPVENPTEPQEETVSKADYQKLEEEIANLRAANESLLAYKNEQEKAEKEAIVEKFSSLLSEETVEKLNQEMANYSLVDFKKEVSVLVLEAQEETLFSKNGTSDAVIINQDSNLTGAARLMQKHCK